MTTLKLSPNASGAGSFTIAAPSTSSTLTLNLPSTLGTNNGSALVSTDASGNLGLGVTPSAWATVTPVFQVNRASFYGYSNEARMSANYYYNAGEKYIASDYATSYSQSNGKHQWYIAPSGTAGNAISFTQAMTLDASGRLGVGTTSPQYRFHAFSSTASEVALLESTVLNSDNVQLRFKGFSGERWAIGNNVATGGTGVNFDFYDLASSALRARIDSSGNVMIAKTALNAAVAGIELRANGDSYFSRTDSTNSQSTLGVYSTGAGAYRFYVGMGGTVYATSTTISAISDIRFKENVRDLDAGLAEVMALKPRLYDWKEGKGANTKNARGFIAQEFEQVFPDLIDEWKDPAPEGEEPYKSVRQDLIPVLVKAIQEQQTLIQDQLAIINTQQTELEQLKAQLTSVSEDVAALKGAK